MAREWGANQLSSRVIYAMTEPYTLIADSTAEALLVPDVTIPARFLETGDVLRATLAGTASNVVTTPGTLIFYTRWGGLTGTVLANSAAMAQSSVANTDRGWFAQIYFTCLGTSIQVVGEVHRGNKKVDLATDSFPDIIPVNDAASQWSSPAVVTPTAGGVLSITAKFSVNTAGTNIRCYSYILEALN